VQNSYLYKKILNIPPTSAVTAQVATVKHDMKGKLVGEQFAGGIPMKKAANLPAYTSPNLTTDSSSRIF